MKYELYSTYSNNHLLSGKVNKAGGSEAKYSWANASSADSLSDGMSLKIRLAKSPDLVCGRSLRRTKR